MDTPLIAQRAFEVAGVGITWPVVTTWAIMGGLTVFSLILRARLRLRPGRVQAVAELIVTALDSEIQATIPGDPGRFRALIGTLLIFVLCANWSSLIPGVEPPTAHLETDAALALVVFVAGLYWGIREQGLGGWLKSFAQPSWVMIPLNLVEQITRHFSLMVRLFGNVMSGVFVISIVLSLAGLLVPVPLMALDMLTGAVQAYIFATLALVFIGSAVSGHDAPHEAPATPSRSAAVKEPPHD